MAVLTTQIPTPAGVAPAYTAAGAGGDTIEAGNDVVLHVKAGATAVNVTIGSPTPCSQGSTHPVVVNVPVSSERMIGPFPSQRFAQPVGGRVNVTYDQVSTITVAAIRI